MHDFSVRLKWLREKKGISQKDMADNLGISQPYYGRFEKEMGQPNLETLVKLPEILGESLDFICGVHIFDREATDLLYEYFQKRQAYIRAKTRLESSIKLLKNEIKPDPQTLFDLIDARNNTVENMKTQMESSYKKMLEYLRTLPEIPEDYFIDEQWDIEYAQYEKRYFQNHTQKDS